MKLSTKGKYGLIAMNDLGISYLENKDGLMTIRAIAEKRNISIAYLERIIAKLKKAGLVKTRRGATGGYVLSRNPKEIYLSEMYLALEGELDLCGCSGNKEDEGEKCPSKVNCISKNVCDILNDSIMEVLEQKTLYDLIKY